MKYSKVPRLKKFATVERLRPKFRGQTSAPPKRLRLGFSSRRARAVVTGGDHWLPGHTGAKTQRQHPVLDNAGSS